jgi:hypothetical protein
MTKIKPKLNLKLLPRSSARLSSRRLSLFMGLFAVAGLTTVVLILAAGAAAIFEPENGSLGNGAVQVSRSDATGGKAVRLTAPAATPTPTATPTPAPGGTPTNCVASPHTCGYPDATNTGWQPTGVTLTVVNQDPYYINTAGTVVDSKDIRGCVYVRAPNVTIRRSKITCNNQPMVKTWEPDGQGGLDDLAHGLVIEDTEFDGQGDVDSGGISFNHYTLRRNNMHHLGHAAKVGTNVVVQDNYVHDIAWNTNSHNGGFPSDGGTGVTIRHNTVFMNTGNGYTLAAYNWIPAGTVVADWLVENNLLAGGNYILYCGAPGHITPNLRVTGNRFSRLYYPNGGYYGPTANCSGATAWTGNFWDNNLATVSP